MSTVLYVTVEVVRQIGILLQPFVPVSASKLLDLMKIPADARGFDHLGASGRLEGGITLDKPEPVFPKYFPPKE
jgi:methionyl-tRNA synthetase